MLATVDQIYFFTWNLSQSIDASNLAVDHLAQRGTAGPFIACLQELPQESSIARVRKSTPAPASGTSAAATARHAALAELKKRRIEVVSTPSIARGLALVHHPALTVQRHEVDEDEEFVAAVFQLPGSRKQLGVVGLHALSKLTMHAPEDHGGSRGLLRHAINGLRLSCDHTVLLGDFNSALGAREITSWHCFYILSGTHKPQSAPILSQRRGVDHPALYAVRPDNADSMGTFRVKDSGANDHPTIDFIATDKGLHETARSKILTTVSAQSIWNAAEDRPIHSDHLPVEGTVNI